MKPSWALALKVTWSIFWRFIVFFITSSLAIGVLVAILLGVKGNPELGRSVGQLIGLGVFFPALLMAVRGTLADTFYFPEDGVQPPQQEAGSRSSSGGDLPPGAPPVLGPQG